MGQTQAQPILVSYTMIIPTQKCQVVIMFPRAHSRRIEVRLEPDVTDVTLLDVQQKEDNQEELIQLRQENEERQ